MPDEKFLKVLYEQMKKWETEGMIEHDQINSIKNYYYEETKIGSNAKNHNFIQILILIGSIFVGVGVILFMGANWEYMSDILKSFILFGSFIITYMVGVYMYFINKSYPKTGYGILFLSNILFGASIFLIGQIYNIGGEFYDGMLLWFIGILPLAYITCFRMTFFLSIILFLVYISSYVMINYDVPMIYINLFIASIGIFLSNLGKLHIEKYFDFGIILSNIGTFMAYLAFFLFTFKDFTRFYNYHDNINFLILIFFVLSILFKLYSWIFKINWYNKAERVNIVHTFFIGILFIFYYLSSSSYIQWDISDSGMLVILNIYFVGMIFGIIYIGILRSNEFYINMSILFLVLFMFGKYFDWFYSMMERSIFFISGGVLLIVIGFVCEKLRKNLVDKISLNS